MSKLHSSTIVNGKQILIHGMGLSGQTAMRVRGVMARSDIISLKAYLQGARHHSGGTFGNISGDVHRNENRKRKGYGKSKDWIGKLQSAGYRVVVCRSAKEAISELTLYFKNK